MLVADMPHHGPSLYEFLLNALSARLIDPHTDSSTKHAMNRYSSLTLKPAAAGSSLYESIFGTCIAETGLSSLALQG